MHRMFSIVSVTLGLFATSVALAQQPKEEAAEISEIEYNSIDFQEAFAHADKPSGQPLLMPTPSAFKAKMATPLKGIDAGLIEEDGGDQPAPLLREQDDAATVADDVATVAFAEPCGQCVATSEPCGQCVATSEPCGQCVVTSEPCQCGADRGFFGQIRDCWHRTDLYRAHIQNLGEPCLFCERPFGVCNQDWTSAMIIMGKADRAVLHDFDFAHDPHGVVALSPRGRQDLLRIAKLMVDFRVPLTIESTDNPDQDEARRQVVVATIAEWGLAISPQDIRILPDTSIGLNGEDANAIEQIRTNEMATGASRTRPYRDSGRATIIPLQTGDSPNRPGR